MKQEKKQGMNKKGVLNLEAPRAVMIFILTLAVIAIAIFLGLTQLVNTTPALNTRTITGNSFSNNTIRLNDTAQTPAAVAGLRNVVLSSVTVTNATGGPIIQAGNYTISGGTFIAAIPSQYNGTNVNVSAAYTNDVNADGLNIVNNVTTGTTGFFTNIPTVFTILGAVVIITAVSLILFAVNRFTQSSGSNSL